jgi:hypothetical protein
VEAISNEAGRFLAKVQSGKYFRILYIGYITKKTELVCRFVIWLLRSWTIELDENLNQLNEVVIISSRWNQREMDKKKHFPARQY